MVFLQDKSRYEKLMRRTLYALLLSIAICSCTTKNDKKEENAGRMLNSARALMIEGNYAAAKDSILNMRILFPTAFEARTTGIVIMDSIELLAAQDTLAMTNSILQVEEKQLMQLETEKRRGHNAEYYKQRTNVFHLKQRVDELGAKVKFYLRKIEVDTQESNKNKE